jgi:hypothetical protein
MSKDTTSCYHSLDIRLLYRKGVLRRAGPSVITWSRRGEVTGSIEVLSATGCLILKYRHSSHDRPWRSMELQVPVTWSSCNYGGSRPWFLCPGSGCCRRVAVLYGGGMFVCRHCRQLVYESQRERPYERALTRAQAIWQRLGASCTAEPFPPKPKGMHSRTYERFCREADEWIDRSWPPWLPRVASV